MNIIEHIYSFFYRLVQSRPQHARVNRSPQRPAGRPRRGPQWKFDVQTSNALSGIRESDPTLESTCHKARALGEKILREHSLSPYLLLLKHPMNSARSGSTDRKAYQAIMLERASLKLAVDKLEAAGHVVDFRAERILDEWGSAVARLSKLRAQPSAPASALRELEATCANLRGDATRVLDVILRRDSTEVRNAAERLNVALRRM